MVETSYLLAYHDELTALPSRRAFMKHCCGCSPLIRLRWSTSTTSSAATILTGTIPGMKCCGWWHRGLARVTGGGQAYRCGGEEFAIVFPGKTTKDVLDDLEICEGGSKAASFRLRGRSGGRRSAVRTAECAGRTDAGTCDPATGAGSGGKRAFVTASIGVAVLRRRVSSPDDVVKAADKALYRRRMEVETGVGDALAGRRARSKTAGIA